MRRQRHWAGSHFGTGHLYFPRSVGVSASASAPTSTNLATLKLPPHRASLSRPIGNETIPLRLAVPAMAIPADALVWVEDGRTGAEMIPMISGHAEPVATSIGRRRRQRYGRQRRHGSCQQCKLTHLLSPILGLVGHVTLKPSQIRHTRGGCPALC